MAKLDAPLLSFNARGQIAKSLVFMGWKGLKTVRQYVTPANPRAAGQVTQRNFFTAAVSYWRGFLTGTLEREGWDRDASLRSKPQSGFNSFVGQALLVSPTDPDASFSNATSALSPLAVNWIMTNLDDGATGDEAGDFDIFAGLTPQALDRIGDSVIAGGEIDFTLSGPFVAGDRVYIQLVKGTIERSGINVVTLVA